MPTATTEKSMETTVSESDLAKSIRLLEKALSGGEKIEKAVIGTDGGLQGKTPSDGDINKDIQPDEEEIEGDPVEAADKDETGIPLADGTISGGGASTRKSLSAEDIPATDEEFAKSLSAAFTDAAPLVDASKGSNFAKSLVMSTIEGLSVTCDEINKSLAESEGRTNGIIQAQSARIEGLEKALSTVLNGVNEVLENVRTVAKSPIRSTTKSVQVLEKSLSGTEQPTLSKAQVSDRLLGMAREGRVDSFTIAKYEATGMIDPALLAEASKGTGR